MVKAVIDTNVFISGIIFGGNPRKIVDSILKREFALCLSPELKAEIMIKLKNKFGLPNESLTTVENALETYGVKFNPSQKVFICPDPKDNFLLELSDEAKADYLVSGDKKVLGLKSYKGARIVAPKEFVDILAKNHS